MTDDTPIDETEPVTAHLLAALDSERRYYQEIVELLPVPVAIVSEEWQISIANRAFRQRFAFSLAQTQTTLDDLLSFPGFQSAAQRIFEAGGTEAITADGSSTERLLLRRIHAWERGHKELFLVVQEVAPAPDRTDLESDPALDHYQRPAPSLMRHFLEGLGIAKPGGAPKNNPEVDPDISEEDWQKLCKRWKWKCEKCDSIPKRSDRRAFLSHGLCGFCARTDKRSRKY